MRARRIILIVGGLFLAILAAAPIVAVLVGAPWWLLLGLGVCGPWAMWTVIQEVRDCLEKAERGQR